MILEAILLSFIPLGAYFGFKRLQRSVKESNRLLMWQFGKFTNTRPGLKGHRFEHNDPDSEDGWADEPDIVEFEDYHYWIRLKPNWGFNLPLIGYYSEANGYARKPPRRF